jgi:single-strand DNA-binding protein
MNALQNKVQLIGNLGVTPEVKSFENGKKIAKLSLATNESYKNAKGDKVINTQWHNLVAWGHTADYIERFFTKGMEVAIEGKLMNRNYTDKTGVKRYVTEILISDLMIVKTPVKKEVKLTVEKN